MALAGMKEEKLVGMMSAKNHPTEDVMEKWGEVLIRAATPESKQTPVWVTHSPPPACLRPTLNPRDARLLTHLTQQPELFLHS
jgi:hypothetical protein